MRHFTLENSLGETLDITTTDILFHEINGLGFDEDNTFKRIGQSWALNTSEYQQATIGGKMLFNASESLALEYDPYYKYLEFTEFISNAPLILKYYPFGLIDNDNYIFNRKVRVSKLTKTEKNEYGVLDCDIEFISYTPWYRIKVYEYQPQNAPDEEHHWVWGGETVKNPITGVETVIESPPLIFEPTDEQKSNGAIPAIFDWEADQSFTFNLSGLRAKAPTKLTIYGPLLNPYWTHGLVSGNTVVPVSSGKFMTSSQHSIEIAQDERLVIDNTDGNYSISKVTPMGSVTSLYSERDFGTECFITARNGRNVINVGSAASTPITKIVAEVHELYATV